MSDRPSDTPPDPHLAEVRATTDSGRNSIAELIKQLADDLSTLLSKEVALAKAEVREAANTAKKGAGSLIGGIVLMLCGVLYLLLAAVFALSLVMDTWLAALIVGAVVLIVGIIMFKAGQKKMEPHAFVPDRTVDSLRKDQNMAKRSVS